jgi:MFS family permease
MDDSVNISSPDVMAARGGFAALGPLVAIVFLGFLAVGAPLPALALYVHGVLGFSNFIVGAVIGVQSLATVLTRHRAGTLCDHRGPPRSVLLGLPLAAFSGVFYLASTWPALGAEGRLAVLVVGRLVMGLGESLFITGTMSWGIARVGAARTGKVMSWQGIAMYAALGLGAPLGLAVQAAFGFVGVAGLTMAAPLLAAAIGLGLAAAPGSGGARAPFHQVVGLIWRPGLVLTLATVPFASLAAFLALDYAARGWEGAGLALGAFGGGFVLVRLVGSHLPDRLGGVVVAAGSLAIEAVGQALLWLAPGPELALAGAALTGIGFSLVFPSMGVVATRRVPAGQRGRAVGNFLAFFDVAVGLTGPVVGVMAGHFGYASAFLVGTAATLGALGMLQVVRRMRIVG